MESATRWWEFYFVRYALGTLVGALIINLAFRVDPRFSDFMLFGLGGDQPASRLTLILGYGLVFCYIASVPILVFHAARLVAWPGPRTKRSTSRKKIVGSFSAKELRLLLCALTCSVTVMLLLQAYLGISRGVRESGFLLSAITTAVVVVVCLEWVTLIVLFFYSERAYERMKALSLARGRSDNLGGIVDSYRHMREHGNSLFIVILELVFGAALIGAVSLMAEGPSEGSYVAELASALVPMILLWLLPGAGIWLFATLLERRFTFDREL